MKMKKEQAIEKINQKGAVLITLIVAMVIIALAGSAMLHFSTTSSYGELVANRQERAYYVAEAGINYARYLFNPNPALPGSNYTNGPFPVAKTFTLSNGQFRVKTSDKPGDPTRLLIESTGIVESGWLTTRQLITKEISKVEVSGSTTIVTEDGTVIPISFDANTDQTLDTTWTVVEDVTSGIIIDETGDLEFKGNEGAITLNPAIVDIPTAMENNDGKLGYFLQVKIDISKMSPGDYYMIGLSFRIQDSDAQNSYGLSFYRSNGDNGPKTWWTLSTFADLRSKLPTVKNDKTYAVLWKKVAGTFYVLAWTEMINTTYDVLTYTSGKWVLKQWASLVVRVNEKFVSGSSGPSKNYIRAYAQKPELYPYGTINWNFNNFVPITWTWLAPSVSSQGSTSTEVRDNTYTSATYTTGQPEIGVHAFYDSFGKGAQLFGDFSTIIQGLGGAGEQW